MKLSKSSRAFRFIIMLLVGVYLLVPLIAMLDFSTRPLGGVGARTLRAWKAIPGQPDLVAAMSVTFAITSIVMLMVFLIIVPTVIWVHLKLPKLKRLLELICLLPLAIPGIVIVVGIAPLYRFLSIHFTESPITLAGVYSMLILPYTYRSLSASLAMVDLHTLAEAARTLGASSLRMIFGIAMPTIRSGVMSGVVISLALVLGEFTISSLLSYDTLQVVIYLLGREDGKLAVAVSLASLLFVFLLLVAIPTTKRNREILDVDLA